MREKLVFLFVQIALFLREYLLKPSAQVFLLLLIFTANAHAFFLGSINIAEFSWYHWVIVGAIVVGLLIRAVRGIVLTILFALIAAYAVFEMASVFDYVSDDWPVGKD